MLNETARNVFLKNKKIIDNNMNVTMIIKIINIKTIILFVVFYFRVKHVTVGIQAGPLAHLILPTVWSWIRFLYFGLDFNSLKLR